jgi:hypothetical protein
MGWVEQDYRGTWNDWWHQHGWSVTEVGNGDADCGGEKLSGNRNPLPRG